MTDYDDQRDPDEERANAALLHDEAERDDAAEAEGYIDNDAANEAVADHWAEVADRERDLRHEGYREQWDAYDDEHGPG